MTTKEAIDLIDNYDKLDDVCYFFSVEGTEINNVRIPKEMLQLKLEPKHVRDDGTIERNFWSLNDYPLYDLYLKKEDAVEQLCCECENILRIYRKNM